MHVIVLGAGVIGVTTAYYLAERGHRVTVLDRADEVGTGASGGNGGQLSYSYTDAMASPALLSKFPGIMAGLDPAFHVYPSLNPQLIYWGQAFLRQCTRQQFKKNTTEVLRLALRSAGLLATLRSRTSLEFSFRKAGKLVMLNGASALAGAEEVCTLKRQNGSDAQVINFDQAVEIEPAVQAMKSQYSGAVYSESDEVGNSLLFTSRLGNWLSTNTDTEFRLKTGVRKVIARNRKLVAVETDHETLKPDAVVVCLGAWSNQVLHPLGINTNIYPMRGYSVTLPVGDQPNSVSITDLGNKMVYSRLDDTIRIAGFADFVGYRTTKDSKRVQQLLETARRVAPSIANFTEASHSPWGGFRPMTPNSQPLTGPSKIQGVYLNTGHGSLGWTLACASGHDVAAGI